VRATRNSGQQHEADMQDAWDAREWRGDSAVTYLGAEGDESKFVRPGLQRNIFLFYFFQ
jgi:hypothetical protein